MKYQIIPVTDFAQNCSLLWCEKTRQAVIVDPGGEAEKIIAEVSKLDVNVTQVWLTHGHLDHVGAAAKVAAHFSIPVLGPQKEDAFWLDALPKQSLMFGLEECPVLVPDTWLEEGDQLHFGEEHFSVLHCPGHTPGHVVFVNAQQRLAITGDVIFLNSVGRSDFPQGDHQTLIASIRDKLLPLGDDMEFLPGHGPLSTFGHERQTNPYLQDEQPIW